MSENPYAPPSPSLIPIPRINDPEQIRRTHLSTESSIKSIGTLYIFGGALFIVGFGIEISNPHVPSDKIGTYLAIALIPILLIWLGLKLRKLSSVASIFSGILSAFGLLAFPVGTIINLIILFTLFSPKGRYVVKPHYRQIIAETGDIPYRTSTTSWILLFIVVLVILFCVIFITSLASL